MGETAGSPRRLPAGLISATLLVVIPSLVK